MSDDDVTDAAGAARRATTAPAIRVRDLTVALGSPADSHSTPTLDRVAFDVPAGGSLLVVGPSGCGKSTLMAVLTGVVPQTLPGHVTGAVDIAGHDPRLEPVARLAARVGRLHQTPGDQLCLAGVREELVFALENLAADPATMDVRAEGALAAVGAGHLADRLVRTLSGGEAQRVALAATLVSEPDVVLLDEPTALLDPASAHDIGALIGGLARPPSAESDDPPGTPDPPGAPGTPHRGARSVVVVEHRLDDLGRLPDAVLVLDGDGRVVAHGETAAVLRSRAHEIAALGCWLPLDVRLEAAGAPGPLGDAATDAWLADLVAGARTSSPGAASAEAPRNAPTTPALRARDLAVLRGRATVVAAVDLDLYPGEILAVVGPNGGGKSTLLRGLAGLEPTTGTVRASDPAPIAMVFQNPEHQFLHRTVHEELHRSARSARSGPPPDERVRAALDDFGLAALADANPFRLSGGQQRRLSLATATVSGPAVLLADEPTFGLDRAQTATTGRTLRALADAGGAVCLVTHDLSLVAEHADRVAVVAGGRLRAVGTAEEILGDGDLCAENALHRGRLLTWWATTGRRAGIAVRDLVRAVDAAAPGAAATPVVAFPASLLSAGASS